MSLGFTIIDGTSGEGLCDKFFSINETMINNSNTDVMQKYLSLFSEYKKKIFPSDVNEKNCNDLTVTDINFLENVLQIKNKIKMLHKEHKLILDKIIEVDAEIPELEKIKQNYIEINKSLEKYLPSYNLMKKESIKRDDNSICDEENSDENITIIHNITSIIMHKKMKLEEYEKEKMQLFEEIKMLKTVICTDDLTQKNNESICFICAEESIKCCFNPCGHTFCNSCASRITNKRCYTCRAPVTSTIKLFFDNCTL